MLTSETLFNFLRDNRGLPFRTMAVFNYLLEATLCGAALILIMLLARRFLRGKLGNRAVYAAWLLVAVRLLVPVAIPNPFMNELRPTLSTDEGARPVADQVRVRFQDAMGELAYTMRGSYVNREPEMGYTVADFTHDVGAYTSYGWTGKWFFFAYLGADGLVLCYMAYQNIRFRRRLKKGRVSALDGDDLAAYRALCEKRNVKPLPVYYVDPLPSACLVGVLRPYIALPLTMQPQARNLALAHELCHHKAHDEWWGVARNLCCAAHWFNPLVWVAAKAVRADCEMACDDRVIAPMDDGERLAYANALVAAAGKRNAPRMSVLATGMTMTGKRLKQRVSAIVRSARVRRGAVAAFLACGMCLTVLAFGTAEYREETYDLAMDKAQYGYQLDEPFDLSAPSMEPLALPAAVDTEEAALAYADQLLATPFLNPLLGETTRAVTRLDDEWRVASPSEWSAQYGCELHFDTQGRLLYWNARPYASAAEYPFKASDSVRNYLDRYVRAFAKDCLGDPGIRAVTLDAETYDLDGRYASGQALDTDGNSLFLYMFDFTAMKLVYYQNTRLTDYAKGSLFSNSVADMRDDLTETSLYGGLTAEDVGKGTFGAEWLAGGEALCVRFTVAANDVSEQARAALRERYGARDVYTLERVEDPYGNRLDYDTAESYLNRPDGADGAAFPAAVSLVEKDGVALRFEVNSLTGLSPSFGLPSDGDVPLGEAVEIAVQAICDNEHISRASMANFRMNVGFMVDANPPYWWIDFVDDEGGKTYSAAVDSPSGTVRRVYGPEDSNG